LYIQLQPIEDDSSYSIIGKDAPSTCESFGPNEKVKEWFKNISMPTVDEENESVISPTNDEMLDRMYGNSNPDTQTKAHKTPSEFTSDSGINNEPDSGLSNISYISHQAVADICNAKIDETNSPNSQVITIGSSNVNGDLSQSNSNFQNPLFKQNSAMSANTDPTTVHEGNYIDHSVATNTDLLPLQSDTFTTTVTGSYVDHNATFNASQPLSHSTSITTATHVGGSYVDHYAATNIDDTNLLSLQSTNSDTFKTAVVGSYVDHNTTSNTSQPLSHSTLTTTATNPEEGSYIDRYVATNDDNTNPLPLQPTFTTPMDVRYVDNYVTSDNDNKIANSKTAKASNSTLSHSTNVPDSSYISVDHAIGVQQDNKSTNALQMNPQLIQNMSGYVTESDV